MKKTAVHFSTTDKLLQKLMDTAEQKCLDNIRDFEGMPVLVEGGGYEKIWLETQPMGGAMYAKRNLEIAVNNQRLFLLCQRSDGRIPGSIEHAGHDVIPQFNKFQGFCFPEEAIDVWYLTEKDPSVLEHLRTVLRKFDDYLWKVRDSAMRHGAHCFYGSNELFLCLPEGLDGNFRDSWAGAGERV